MAVSGDSSGGGAGLRVGARVVGLAVARSGGAVGCEVNPITVGLSVVGDRLGATVATAPCCRTAPARSLPLSVPPSHFGKLYGNSIARLLNFKRSAKRQDGWNRSDVCGVD